MHVHCLLGLKSMTTYERVKPATAGAVGDTYSELKMFFLFYFVLESEKKQHNVGTAVVPDFPLYYSCFFFFISTSNANIHPAVHLCNSSQ